MKKLAILAALFFCAITASAQLNVQFHYDMGKAIYKNLDARPQWTATIENFTPDKWGSTYFFVDANFAHSTIPSVYGEISRELKFWKAPVAVHLEYNGGTGVVNNAYLAGAAYNWASKDFSKTFSVQAMYRYDAKHVSPHNWQLTAVWGIHFAKGLCTFSGYADLARNTALKSNLSFSSEPQFWFNFAPLDWVDDNCKISVGAEVELSNYLGEFGKFYAIPTVAAKWTF